MVVFILRNNDTYFLAETCCKLIIMYFICKSIYRSTGTPIAYSSKDKETGEPKCLYRFVLSDRNKEIAIGDIVKAPIEEKSSAKTMKFNALKPFPINKHDKDDHAATQAKDDQVLTNTACIENYVGIVRHLGTTKVRSARGIEEDVVTCLGLELMDPVGNSDGRLFNQELGEYERFFTTKPNYAVFVSIKKVVKITPGNLFSTLSNAIQRLNETVVSLKRSNHEYMTQNDKHQQHINHLIEKNKQLTKLATQTLEKINDQKAVTMIYILYIHNT